MSSFKCTGGGATQIILITDKGALYLALATVWIFTIHILLDKI